MATATATEIRSGIDWEASTYEEVVARHRWVYPKTFNIAHVACDRHATGEGKTALVAIDKNGSRTYSFDEIAFLSDRCATVLARLGVERGDRVAVFLSQRVECAVAHLAAFKLGAVSVPLSPLFRTEALAYRLEDSAARVVVTDRKRLRYLPSDLEAHVLGCDEDMPDDVLPFWELVPEADRTTCVDTSADDPAMLLYTSGTSGLPKGALHAHRFLPGRLSGFELMHRLEQRPGGDRAFWTPADWAWVAGLVDSVLTPWVFGCPVLAWRRHGFDPEAVVAFLRSSRPRSLFMPPTALNRMRSAMPDPPRIDVESVHTAGEPLSPETYAWAKAAFGTVYELYGMTEMGATIANGPFFPVKPGSMGKPVPGHVVTLLRADGTEIPSEAAGETGEIAIRRGDPGMFLGYFHDTAATDARFRGDWLVTGDLAVRDDEGYFFYRGRADDVFNTSGYRVGPTEIEQSIGSHPAVQEVAVVGAPDAERGEIVKAFVVVRSGYTPNDELVRDIQAHVKSRLAAYEYPRAIVFARELPMTASGKIRRVDLRAPDADRRFGIQG